MGTFRVVVFFLGIIASLGLLGGCADDGSTGDSRADEANQRWPEKGSYQYKFNENGCITEQRFSGKAAYCLGLTDRALNRSCALSTRRQVYKNNCGNDFEESNVAALQSSGYDSYLGRHCSTAKPPTAYFARLSEYCSFLGNETLHKNCLWERRQEEFQMNRCPGYFPERAGGPVATPTPRPSPTPYPYPTPTPTPLPPPPLPDIIQDLEDAGIDVEWPVREVPGGGVPGEEPMQYALPKFLNTLESVKHELIGRKHSIKSLRIIRWTMFDPKDGMLTLDVIFNEQDIRAYLPILDRRLEVEAEIGIPVSMGIEIYGHETDKIREISDRVAWFERNASRLKALRGVVSLIKFDSYSHYWPSTRELSVKETDYAMALEQYLQVLSPLAPFFQFADQEDLKIDLDMEVEKEPVRLREVTNLLWANRSVLSDLKRAGWVDEITIPAYSDKTHFWSNLKTLHLATQGEGYKIVPEVIKAMGLSAKASQSLGIEIETASYELDARFIECAKRLTLRLEAIRSKLAKIQDIRFSYETRFSYRTLTIGHEKTISELDRVLKSI